MLKLIENLIEMDLLLEEVLKCLNILIDYKVVFDEVYGKEYIILVMLVMVLVVFECIILLLDLKY